LGIMYIPRKIWQHRFFPNYFLEKNQPFRVFKKFICPGRVV
jgi:hypothetical protein